MPNEENQFQAKFEIAPEFRIEAPGRVNLIGEHIDYLDGWVMPAAIDQRITVLAASDSSSGGIEVWSAEQDATTYTLATTEFEARTRSEESWLNYLIGVFAAYAERGIKIPACRIGIFSTLPSGAGLSSSAALETATALLIEALTGFEISVGERALLCQKAEHECVGVPCGIMDQLTVGAGVENHVLRIDCRDLTVEPIPLPEDVCLVVADTGVKHALGDGEYRKRREDCEAALTILEADSFRDVSLESINQSCEELGDRLFRRAHHAVTEMLRVADFAEALNAGQFHELGRLMREGHNSLRDNFEVSCAELDALVDSGFEFGAERGHLGSRMTGGGFGGSTIHLVQGDAAPAFLDHLQLAYGVFFNRDLNCFVTHASDGARCEHLSFQYSTQ